MHAIGPPSDMGNLGQKGLPPSNDGLRPTEHVTLPPPSHLLKCLACSEDPIDPSKPLYPEMSSTWVAVEAKTSRWNPLDMGFLAQNAPLQQPFETH